MNYFDVRLIDNPKRRILLQVTREDAEWLIGIEVTEQGEPVAPNKHDERVRVIQKSAIRDRIPMGMNLHYGDLEPIGLDPMCGL